MSIQSVDGSLPNAVVAPLNKLENANAAPPTAKLARATVETETDKDAQPSALQLDEAVKVVNDFVGLVNKSLHFSVDDDTGKTVVKVIDSGTKELIRQIPSEEMLAIAKALDGIKGLLLHQKA